MDGFDIIFEIFTLLLGLAVAEVLSGFAGLLKLRARAKAGVDPVAAATRIGWLVPLLALLVLAHQTGFWIDMFQLRGALPFNMLTVIGVLAVVGYYYLVSAMLFPDDPALWPDYDAYFRAHRRFVTGSIILIAVVSDAAFALLVDPPAAAAAGPAWAASATEIASNIGLVALIALFFVKAERWHRPLLLVILADFLIETALSPIVPYA